VFEDAFDNTGIVDECDDGAAASALERIDRVLDYNKRQISGLIRTPA